jgi:hypothetical protein
MLRNSAVNSLRDSKLTAGTLYYVPQNHKYFSHLYSSFVNTVTGSRYADCHCYSTAGYIVAAADVTEFPEICAVATKRKGGYEFHIRRND